MSLHSEASPLLGLQFVGRNDHRSKEEAGSPTNEVVTTNANRKNFLWSIFLSFACIVAAYHLRKTNSWYRNGSMPIAESAERSFLSSTSHHMHKSNNNSPYTKVQTLSFQIYTGGAPAFVMDEITGEEKKNHECKGLHSYGLPEDSDDLQCYLGLEDTNEDVERRLSIMQNAVDRAYDVSNKDDSILKIFIAPEFYFRGLNGAYDFVSEEEEEEDGECSDVCQILKGLEDIVADERFENWLFLFGTVIASETLATDETDFDYQFYNFAPLYKGFDPATTKRIGKNFIVPKRYVSNIDFLTPMRDLTNRSLVLDETDYLDELTVMNPHANGIKKYHNDMWTKYKSELTTLGYNMIEYGWLYMDGISFSVEICLDHLTHRALMTYMADVVTGSKTRIPSSANGSVEWVGIPKHQAQISLVSSAGMDVVVESLALADGGHIFLQDGMDGNVNPHRTYGEDDCRPNEYEFFGGSQCIKRTAVVSATDVTFEYEMNLNFINYDLYPENNGEDVQWKDILKGVFSTAVYKPKLTVYDPVNIALTT